MKRVQITAVAMGLILLLSGCGYLNGNTAGSAKKVPPTAAPVTPAATPRATNAAAVRPVSVPAGLWIEADEDGSYPEFDNEVIMFMSDGTGYLFVEVGDGGSNSVYFSYTLAPDGTMQLTQTGTQFPEYKSVLPDRWKAVRIADAPGSEGPGFDITMADGRLTKFLQIRTEQEVLSERAS